MSLSNNFTSLKFNDITGESILHLQKIKYNSKQSLKSSYL